MPSNIINSLDAMRPSVAARFRAWENDVLAESKSDHGPLSGVYLKRFETLRSFERSNMLYAQGRTSPGSIVTNAKAGQSRHNFGGAGDYYPVLGEHGEIDWNFDHNPRLMAAMHRASELAAKHGIVWGGTWKSIVDLPHFQAADEPPLDLCRKKWPEGWKPGVSRE